MRKLASSLALVTLIAASCGPGDVEFSSPGAEELGFVVHVVDATADAGAGLSLATDAEGNPHLSYLVFQRPPAEGEPPPGLEIGVPERPTVMHAHFVGKSWTRSPVAAGVGAGPEDQTAIVIDAEGTHHVAWSEGDAVFYSNNAGGEFSEAERVAGGYASGLAIAADGQGAPWLSYYEDPGEAEGPAALVRVASQVGGGWQVDTAAEAAPEQPATTGIGVAGDQVLVAYGDGARTMLARSDGDVFASEVADEDGGLGVSLTQDGDGNPHLAYYAQGGAVKHAHSISGSPWEVSSVAESGGGPEEGWSASIDLADDGTHHVAYTQADGIGYASNAEGEFAVEEIGEIANAVDPRVGAGAEGAVFVGWYDSQDLALLMAIRSDEDPLLALPEPVETEEPEPGPTTEPTGPPPCEPDGTELQIAAPPGAAATGFDKDCLAAPAGEPFTIEFANNDEGVPHNVSVYPSQEDGSSFSNVLVGPGSAAQEDTIRGPDTTTYEGEPQEEGTYFFQCDVHFTTMTGTFVVQ